MAKIKRIICHVGNDATLVVISRGAWWPLFRFISLNFVALDANNVTVVDVIQILPATEMYLKDSSFCEYMAYSDLVGHYWHYYCVIKRGIPHSTIEIRIMQYSAAISAIIDLLLH